MFYRAEITAEQIVEASRLSHLGDESLYEGQQFDEPQNFNQPAKFEQQFEQNPNKQNFGNDATEDQSSWHTEDQGGRLGGPKVPVVPRTYSAQLPTAQRLPHAHTVLSEVEGGTGIAGPGMVTPNRNQFGAGMRNAEAAGPTHLTFSPGRPPSPAKPIMLPMTQSPTFQAPMASSGGYGAGAYQGIQPAYNVAYRANYPR